MSPEIENLVREVQEICSLLEKTTFRKQADWYKVRCDALGSENLRPKEIESTILEIKIHLLVWDHFMICHWLLPRANASRQGISGISNRSWWRELERRSMKCISRREHFI